MKKISKRFKAEYSLNIQTIKRALTPYNVHRLFLIEIKIILIEFIDKCHSCQRKKTSPVIILSSKKELTFTNIFTFKLSFRIQTRVEVVKSVQHIIHILPSSKLIKCVHKIIQ